MIGCLRTHVHKQPIIALYSESESKLKFYNLEAWSECLRADMTLFDSFLYIPFNNFSVMSGQVFLGRISTKQGLMCLAQGHNTVMPVRLEPATPWSQVKYSTTEPLRSQG